MQNDLYYLLSLIPLVICLAALGLRHLLTVSIPEKIREGKIKKDFNTLLEFERQWPAPIRSQLMGTILLVDTYSLAPEPLSTILTYLSQGESEKARDQVTSFCTPFFMKRLIYGWRVRRSAIPHYSHRRPSFQKARKVFKDGRYAECNQILLAQIEGMIMNWVAAKIGRGDSNQMIPNLQFKKPPSMKMVDEAVEAVIHLLNHEIIPEKWIELNQSLFPNRNDPILSNDEDQEFDQFSSIRLFLLLNEVISRKY